MILTGGVGLARERAAGETNQGSTGKSHTQCWGTGAGEIKDSLEQTPALKLWKSSECGKSWAQLQPYSGLCFPQKEAGLLKT